MHSPVVSDRNVFPDPRQMLRKTWTNELFSIAMIVTEICLHLLPSYMSFRGDISEKIIKESCKLINFEHLDQKLYFETLPHETGN